MFFLVMVECSSCNDKSAINAKWSTNLLFPCNPVNLKSTRVSLNNAQVNLCTVIISSQYWWWDLLISAVFISVVSFGFISVVSVCCIGLNRYMP